MIYRTSWLRHTNICMYMFPFAKRKSSANGAYAAGEALKIKRPCIICSRSEATYEPEPCGCRYTYCKSCAFRLATGGRCKKCSEFFGGMRLSSGRGWVFEDWVGAEAVTPKERKDMFAKIAGNRSRLLAISQYRLVTKKAIISLTAVRWKSSFQCKFISSSPTNKWLTPYNIFFATVLRLSMHWMMITHIPISRRSFEFRSPILPVMLRAQKGPKKTWRSAMSVWYQRITNNWKCASWK